MTRYPRVSAGQLSAGLRGFLSKFEKATRAHEALAVELSLENLANPSRPVSKQTATVEERTFRHYDKARQAFLRKLLRLENGVNEGNVEQLKRDFRKLAKAYVVIAANPAARDMFPNEWKLAEEIASHRRRL